MLVRATIQASHKGESPMKRPNATPSTAECARASPNMEYLLKTRNSPTELQRMEMIIPDTRACGIDSYDTASKVILDQW